MGVANRIVPRNACGRPIRETFEPRKYSAIRYVFLTHDIVLHFQHNVQPWIHDLDR